MNKSYYIESKRDSNTDRPRSIQDKRRGSSLDGTNRNSSQRKDLMNKTVSFMKPIRNPLIRRDSNDQNYSLQMDRNNYLSEPNNSHRQRSLTKDKISYDEAHYLNQNKKVPKTSMGFRN